MLAFVVNGGQSDQRVVLLEQLLEKLGYVISRKDTITALMNDPELKAHSDSLVLIPATETSNVNVEGVIGLAGQLKRHGFVIHVADDVSPADYKALIRTGVADSVSWDSAKGEIFEICQRHRAGRADAAPSGAKGGSPHTVISFQGTGGGAGNTTLALETGVYLASLKGMDARRIAIVDLDFQRSVMCDYLNLPPRLDMADFMRNPQRLDNYMLDIFTSKHQSGLDLFACENRELDYSAIDGSAIFSLLDQLTERYDTVLLDAPRCWTAWLDRVLMNSDCVFVTGRYSVPSVKQIAHELKHLRELNLGPENVSVIINECQKTLLGGIVRKSDIDAVLADQRIFYVQQDLSFALECVNIGVSMVQSGPKHGICRDIRKIGEAVRAVRPRVMP
jgi:pilus assembly protein CpaE